MRNFAFRIFAIIISGIASVVYYCGFRPYTRFNPSFCPLPQSLLTLYLIWPNVSIPYHLSGNWLIFCCIIQSDVYVITALNFYSLDRFSLATLVCEQSHFQIIRNYLLNHLQPHSRWFSSLLVIFITYTIRLGNFSVPVDLDLN